MKHHIIEEAFLPCIWEVLGLIAEEAFLSYIWKHLDLIVEEAFLPCIWEVLGLNLSLDFFYYDGRFFVIFLSPSSEMLRWYNKMDCDSFLCISFLLYPSQTSLC
jgi:hypothetical protein